MISQPEKRISKKALKVWRLSGALGTLFISVPAIAMIALSIIFSWPLWIPIVVLILVVANTWFSVFLLPSLWWKRWRYEVREQEIEIQKGLFVIKRTLVPMVRVQHVDTSQGPILRKYKLATVSVSTAATIHEIPALEEEEAEALRVQISRLARVADEDV
ncbi:hypothetical protein D1B31_19585 [Neobacillus notoginsengisoli]|uniref:YdbS-like PH domain-containing protein n=1 Tax=Neobacillus notoginsengisoli TaxID=1578198 RepID=A0A417YMU6_9BACI|nr:PH domain-containing protein [Neobacillus notoginsengisoli]RHW34866.1 hypothetical protein D1B31_19585 [Neobacillus notoginsengisoli]